MSLKFCAALGRVAAGSVVHAISVPLRQGYTRFVGTSTETSVSLSADLAN
jgi:hypothetical protein